MSAAIDVNVLLFASDTASPLYRRAAEFLEERAKGPDILYLGETLANDVTDSASFSTGLVN